MTRQRTEEYKSSTTVGSSLSTSTVTLLRTSSHLLLDASWTTSQSQSGTSSSAFVQACSGLMKDIPNLLRTDPVDVLKESNAPAWVAVGLEVNGNDKEVRFDEMVIVVEDDGELWKRPDVTTD